LVLSALPTRRSSDLQKTCSVTHWKISNSLNTNTTPPSKLQLPSNTVLGMIWAQSLDGVIGLDGAMPWDVPEDLQHFKQMTMGQVLIMGRRTWSSFPDSVRPRPGRTSLGVSASFSADPTDPNLNDDRVHVVADLQSGLELAGQLKSDQHVWVLGGGTLYDQAIDVTSIIERSVFNLHVDGDTYAPPLGNSWASTTHDASDGSSASEASVPARCGPLYTARH